MFVAFLYVGVISVNSFMCVDSIASQVLSQACVSETCLSVLFHVVVIVGGFNICIRCCWCFSCGRLVVIVGAGGEFMFVRDVHFSGIFRFALPDKSSYTRGGFVCGHVLLFDSFGSTSSLCSPWR